MELLLLLMLLLITGLAEVRAGVPAPPRSADRRRARPAVNRWPTGMETGTATHEAAWREAAHAPSSARDDASSLHRRACAEFCADGAVLLEQAPRLADDGDGPALDAPGDVTRIWLFPNGAWRVVPPKQGSGTHGAAVL